MNLGPGLKFSIIIKVQSGHVLGTASGLDSVLGPCRTPVKTRKGHIPEEIVGELLTGCQPAAPKYAPLLASHSLKHKEHYDWPQGGAISHLC